MNVKMINLTKITTFQIITEAVLIRTLGLDAVSIPVRKEYPVNEKKNKVF